MAKYTGTLSGATTYSSVIGKAITDFDSIFDALYNKSVVDLNGTALNTNTTGVATENYATLITNQLFRVSGVTSSSGVVAPSGVIANYSGASSSLIATPTLTYSGETATLTVAMKDAGYYDGTSTVSTTFNTSAVTLSGELNKASTTPYSYTAGANNTLGTFRVAPASGTALREVNIAEGDLDVTIAAADVSTSVTNDIDFTVQNSGIGSNVTLTAPAAADLENYVTLSLAASSSVSSTITVAPQVSFTPGYISEGPLLPSTEYPTINETAYNETAVIYIPKGSASVQFSGGAVTVTDDTNHSIISSTTENPSAAAPSNTYEIKVEAGSGTLTGTTTSGWVDGGQNVNMGSVAAQTKRLFIAAGEVPDNSVSVSLAATSSDVIVNSNDQDAFEISINRASGESATTTTAITEGYVADASYTTTTSVTGLTLKIPVGYAAVNTSLSSVTYDYTGGTIGTTTTPSSGNYYTITPKVNVSAALNGSSSQEGYLIPSSSTITATGLTNVSGNPLYIKKGSAELSASMSTTTGSGSILLSQAPTGTEGTDYYKITADASVTIDPGYITDNEVIAATPVNYYVPKAQLSYIENSTAGAIIQVTSAGYVASGTLTAVSGTLDMAAVLATLTDSGSILKTTGASGDYSISIAKAATTNAGYISGTAGEGTVALADTYYIGHGSVTVSPVIDSVSFAATPTKDTSGASTVYKYTATAAGTNSKTVAGRYTFNPGYIKADDVTLTAIPNKTADLSIPEAVLDVTLGDSASLGTTVTGMTEAVGTSAYYVTPTLTNATAQASVSTAGYVDTTVTSSTGTITITNPPKTYIKAGTTTSLTNSTPATLTKNTTDLNSTSKPQGTNYSISLSGTVTVSGNLDEGYYGASNKSISTSRSVSDSVTIAHGQAVVNPTAATVGFSTSFTRITDLLSEDDSHFEAITASATSVTLSNSGSTTGYVNIGNTSDWVLGSALSSSNDNTFYIRKYAYGGDSGSTTTAVSTTSYNSETVYTPTYSSFASNDSASDGIVNDIVLNTAGTYNDKNILVKLSADAVGSNVVTDLTRLNNRLAGTLVRSGA